MSSDNIAISAVNLGKTYRIFDGQWRRVLQIFNLRHKKFYREFKALGHATFTIPKGETVGVIGKNGSGKSTLLQLICGVSKPTEGGAIVNGRICALLELGAGFHPEFTGRENVYMQAAIMGITRSEIDKRFSEIEAFAGIGEFIEQPVKTYSSGMFVRLAFSAIAHMDPSVLVIDEALSVGDALFAQKCMRFLMQFKERGTLLVVSHDMNTITSLCDRVIWLDKGEIQAIGPTKEVCDAYLVSMFGSSRVRSEITLDSRGADRYFVADQRRDFWNNSNLRNDLEILKFDLSSSHAHSGHAQIIEVALINEENRPYAWVVGGEKVTLRIKARETIHITSPILGFIVQDRSGRALFGDNTYLCEHIDQTSFGTLNNILEANFTFQMPRLPVGDYSVTAAVAEGTQAQHIMHDWLPESLLFKAHTSNTSEVLGLPMVGITLRSFHTAEAD